MKADSYRERIDNALHPVLIPSVLERFIQRLVQFEPMLGICTLGIMMHVPVVSLKSILELLGGSPVSDQEDREAMHKFLMQCLRDEDGMTVLPFAGMDEYSCTNPLMAGKLPGT